MKSGQKYKIYINDNPLVLNESSEKIEPVSGDAIVVPYIGKKTQLLNFIDMLEKSSSGRAVEIYSDNVKKLYTDFKGLFKYIKASGGVVWNEENNILLIYRRGRWDLPKGKKNKKEKMKYAAIREVEEETGLRNVILTRILTKTYHTYRLPDGKRVLKRTSWFGMKSNSTELKLQTEEEITDAKWMKAVDFLESDLPTFNTIKDVLRVASSGH